MRKQLALWLFFAGTLVRGQVHGVFTPTGRMTGPRSGHVATLLPTGQVLLTGGRIVGQPFTGLWAAADLYDPATGTFSFAGNNTTGTGQLGHTSTVLPNGKVLIAGGGNSRRVALWDPATKTFLAAGDTLVPRSGHSAVLLNNGKVLLAGGTNPWRNDAEVFDPDTGTSRPADPFRSSNYDCDLCPPALALANGQVFFGATTPAQVYDPADNTFALASRGSRHATATLLPDGKVLLAGGNYWGAGQASPLGAYHTADLYDPVAKTLGRTQSMTWGRGAHLATLMPDGTVFVIGGGVFEPEIFDPATERFSRTWDLSKPQYDTATLLNDGRILLTQNGLAELYTPLNVAPAPVLHGIAGTSTILEIYCTSLLDGAVIPPQIMIGGKLAEVLYFGKTQYPNVSQINVRVPSGFAPGAAVPLRMSYLGRFSNEVTIGVR